MLRELHLSITKPKFPKYESCKDCGVMTALHTNGQPQCSECYNKTLSQSGKGDAKNV